ncbi:MAG: hypothetical protein ABI432_14250 [Flavobacteriales bacterium]
MQQSRSILLRSLSLVLATVACSVAFGQGAFTVNGRMKIEGGDLSGARAVVYKDGQKERTITTGLSKFSLDLALNANYVISFEKDGFVAKKLSFNTRVPAEAVANGFTPFDFAVSLFKQYDDINIVVFNQPVGLIRYESSIGDFDYDTDYTKSIQSQLQQVLAEVEKKQKEETQAAEEGAKRAAEETKEKARADAEAQKQAAAQQAAQQRAEAEAKKKAEADARAEQARLESARKEEEKRQAEARRSEEEQRKAQPAPVAEVPKPAPKPPAPLVAAKKEPPPPPRVQRSGLQAKASEDQDSRRTATPTMVEEASRMAAARAAQAEEARPEVVAEVPETIRTEELLVEPTKVMTVVHLETAGVKTEYRKVIHKWGAVFYFKDGKACTQQVYEQEAIGEQLAASPRGKMD